MDCSMPGFPVLHHFLELAQTYVLQVGDAIQPSRLLSSPFPHAFSLYQHQIRVVSNKSTLHIRWPKCIVASASASVLPMNIQHWFPIRLTGLITLQSKGCSRVFSSITVWKHQFFAYFLYGPPLTSIHDYYKSHSFDCGQSQQSDVSLFLIRCLRFHRDKEPQCSSSPSLNQWWWQKSFLTIV